MAKHPPQDVILAHDGERITFKLDFKIDPPEQNPVFLLNGSSESLGRVFGVRLESKPNQANFNTTIHLDTPGTHIVHGIWSTDGEMNLEEIESVEAIDNHPNYEMVEWQVHVISQSASLDDIREFIDDLIRVGTMAWAGKLLKEKLEDSLIETDIDTDNDEVDEEYIQEVITNYNSE